MNGAFRLLFRVLVQRYYFLNGGFFLVVFLLLFGVIDPAASLRLHLDLMIMMGSRPWLLAGVLAVLGLYFVKCLRFAALQPALPENGMLYELQALPPHRLRRYLGLSFTAIYAPALCYCLCILLVSFQHRAWLAAAATLAAQSLLILLAVRSLERRCMQRLGDPRADRLLRKLDALRPDYLRPGQYFAAFLLNRKKTMLFLLKAGSLLLLQLMVYINRDEPERAGTFYVLLFLIVAHGLIPWQLRQFGESLPWLRNLPIPLLRRYASFAGTYALLFLPELIFLLLHVHSSLGIADILSFYALSVTTLCGLHAGLYLPGLNMDRYLILMLFLYPLSIIALAVLSPWTLAAFWLVSSVLLFMRRYYRSEMQVE